MCYVSNVRCRILLIKERCSHTLVLLLGHSYSDEQLHRCTAVHMYSVDSCTGLYSRQRYRCTALYSSTEVLRDRCTALQMYRGTDVQHCTAEQMYRTVQRNSCLYSCTDVHQCSPHCTVQCSVHRSTGDNRPRRRSNGQKNTSGPDVGGALRCT